MKTIIYFIRHGAVYNPKNVLYGRLPRFPLSKDGKEKIISSAGMLQIKGIQYLYSSPMLRTCQTAKILGGIFGLKINISSLINEVRIIFAGDQLKHYKENIQPYLYSEKYIKQGQESIDAIADRMLRFVKIVLRRHCGCRILAVSHGDPVLILRAMMTNKEFTWEYKKQNYLKTGEWFTLTYEDDEYYWT